MILTVSDQNKNVPKSLTGKTWIIIKLTIVLLLFFTFQVSAKSHAERITIVKNNIHLSEVFKAIEQQTGFHFFYDKDMIQKTAPIDVALKDATLEQALSACLEGQQLTYTIVKNTVVIRPEKKMTYFQAQGTTLMSIETTEPPPIDIHGKVRDENGNPLANASVTIKGTNRGVTTNSDGDFTISVPSSQTVLMVSYAGYTGQEILVGNRNIININLLRKDNSLSEVVVTALGISKEKKSLAYSVTEVSGESFVKAREINLGNALSGKIAGVNATSTATGPGGSSRVIIRGNGSLNGNNQPLYVINGVPIDNSNLGSVGMWGGYDGGDGLSSINPDDIENISVLKGGSAAALYGSRAANGVILITTKSGKAQKGIGVELNSTYTTETPLVFPDWQDQYGSGTHGEKPTTQNEAIASGTVSWGAKLDGSLVVQPDGIARPYSAQGNNIKKFYNIGNTFSNTIALNGGNENANFRFSASNMDNNGIIPNSSIKRKTFSLSANANLAKKVIFQGSAQYNIEDGQNRPYVSDQPYNVNAAPMLLATNINIKTLKPGWDENDNEIRWHIGDANNPYFIVNKVKNNDERRRLIGEFSIRYNILDYLYIRGRFGIDYYNLKSKSISPNGIQYWSPGMNKGRRTTYETNVEGLIGFNKSFGVISLNALAGGNQMHNVVDGINLSSGRFNVPFQYFITNGTSQQFGEFFSEYAINSLFASTDIGFNNYLYLSLTGRKDWFSTLPIAKNNLFYPSAGLSFVFSDAWNDKPSWLTYGKVRTSWAQVGGGAPDPYSLSLTYSAAAQPNLGQPMQSISGRQIPNSNIKPYTSTTTEAGLELKALNNRIGADITLYNRQTTNDIVGASVPTSTSYANVLLNVGKVQNKGIEVLFTGSPVSSKTGFSWDISYNMGYNKNTVVKIAEGLHALFLADGQVRTKNGFIYHYEGMPFGQIAGYKMKRDAKGSIVYDRASGLPVQSDFMALGNGVAPLTLGLTNNFHYKNFSFSFLVDGKFGGKLYSATNAYGDQWGLAKRTVENNVRETGVTETGVDIDGLPYTATVPAQTYFQGIALKISDEYVYDASFFKLRQVVLGYSFPSSILSKTPIQSASLSRVARNLLLLYSKVPNIDPESTYHNTNSQGLEMYGVPPTRSLGLNLLIRF